MRESLRKKLRAKGWEIGSAAEFLGLSEAEQELIGIKLSLGRILRENRRRQKLSQARLAKRIRSSQSRVAKMEAGDPSVSMDLLVRSLLVIGAPGGELARAFRGRNAA